MPSENLLLSARAAVERQRGQTDPIYRPLYHFSVPCGWMNDPNGLVLFRGEYHLFYQHYPYDPTNGVMHWGHAKSRDLVCWEHLPVALAPDMPYDRDGCWSGGAMQIGEQLALIYTGNREGTPRAQTQNVALSRDGVDFEKYAGNPVFAADSAPKGVDGRDFRDPFVWKQNGRYYCLIGTLQDGVPTALVYRSDDFFAWNCLGVFLRRENSGYCYECPNFADLGEKQLLLLSPVDFPADGLRFRNRSSVVWSLGTFSEETGAFSGGPFGEADAGTDFYATQTVRTEDGRAVLLAWMNMWERTQVTAELGHGWQGMCTFPREVWAEDGALMQRPVSELSAYERDPVEAACALSGERIFAGIGGRSIRLRIEADVSACRRFSVRLFASAQGCLLAEYDCAAKAFTMDRRRTLHPVRGNAREREGVRSVRHDCGGTLKLDILLDRCSAEIFLGRGEAAMSMLVYNGDADGVVFCADGNARVRVKKTEIAMREEDRG